MNINLSRVTYFVSGSYFQLEDKNLSGYVGYQNYRCVCFVNMNATVIIFLPQLFDAHI